MANDSLMFGAGGLVVGAILGMMSSGPDLDSFEERLGEKIEASGASASATDEQLAALTEKLAALQASIASGAEQQAAAGTTVTDAVKDQIDGAVSALSDTISAAGDAQTGKIEAALGTMSGDLGTQLSTIGETLGGQLGAVGDGVAAIQSTMSSHHGAMKSDSAGSSETEATAMAQPAATAAPEPAGTGVGQTELLMDGAVRVFVSGIDPQAGTARVAVNGLATAILGGYESVNFDHDGKTCELILDNITDGRVEMSPSCPE